MTRSSRTRRALASKRILKAAVAGIAAAQFFSFFSGPRAHAATLYWDTDGSTAGDNTGTGAGLGGTGNWSTAVSNWWDGVSGTLSAWTESSSAVFEGTAGTVTLSGPRTVANMNFNTNGYLVTASTLTLAAGTVTVNGGVTATISSTVAGTNGLVLVGGGVLAFTSSANTITGPVSISGGSVLELTTSSRIGGTGAGAGNITLDNGTLRNDDTAVGGTFLTANRSIVIGANGGTIDLPGGSAAISIYTSGAITASGATATLTKTGSGTFRFTTPTSATFTKLVVKGGLWQGAADTIFGAVPAVMTLDAITLDGGGISSNAGQVFATNRGIFLTSSGGTINTSSNFTFPNPITGTGDLTKTGTSTTTLNNNASQTTYSGATIITAGNVTASATNSASPNSQIRLPTSGTSATFQISNSQVIGSLSGGSTSTGLVNINGASLILTLGGDGTSTTYGGQISGTTGRLTKEGTGVFGLANFEPAVTGATTINNGTLKLANAAAGLNNASALTIAAGATYDMNTFNDSWGTLSGAGQIINAGNITLLGSGSATYSGTINSSGTLTKGATSTGTTAISGNFTVGTVTVNAGILTLSGSNNITSNTVNIAGAGTLAASSGRINFNSNNAVGGADVFVTGPGTEISCTAVGITTGNTIHLNSAISSLTDANQVQIETTSGNSWTISGKITGVGALLRDNDGAGTITLSGPNDFSGGFYITNRTVILGSKSALGTGTFTIGDPAVAPATAISFNSNTALSGANALANAVTVNRDFSVTGSTDLELAGAMTLVQGNSTVTVTNSASTIFSGAIGGTGGLIKAGTGVLTLANSGNTYSGATSITAGVLSISNAGALGGTSGVTIGSATTATLKTNASLNLSAPITFVGAGGTIDIDPNITTFSGAIGGTAGFTKVSAGTLVLTNPANSYSGAANINAGTLATGANDVLPNGSAINVSGGTLDISTFSDTVGNVTLSGGAIVGTSGVLSGASYAVQSGSVSAILGGGAALTKSTTGAVTLSGANTYTGGTNVNAGTLLLGGNDVLADSGAVVVAGGTLDISSMNDTVGNVTLASGAINGTSGVLSGNSFGVQSGSVSAILGGTGALTKTTGGTVTLSGANTFTGATNVNGGALVLSENASNSSSLSIASGATLEYAISSGLKFNSGTTISGSGTLRKSGAGTVNFGAGGVVVWQLGSGALIDVQGGELTGGSSFNDNWVSNLADLNVASGAIFSGVEASVRVNALTGSGTVKTGYGSNSGSIAVGVDNGSGTFSGVIADTSGGDTGALVKLGNGTQVLTGVNTFTGGVNVNAGTLVSGANGSLSSGNVTVGGGILDVGATNNTVGAVQLTSGSINGTTGVLSGDSFDMQSGGVSAILGGTGAMTKSTPGTVTLSGANTYSGGTAINAGVLRVNNLTGSGTGGGDVNVNSTGTLAGSGSIAGNVIVNTGGHVAAGNSIGTITVGGLTLNAGAVLDTEVGAPNSIDEIVVTTPSTGLTLNGGTVNLTNVGGLDIGTYVLIDYNTAFAGSLGNLSVGTAPGGFTYSLVNDTGATAIDLVVSELTAANATWNVDSSGNWSTLSNWTPGIPSGVDAVANFGSVISAARTVTLNGARTVGTLNFNNANSYTLAGSPLTLAVSSGNAAINVVTGSHVIASAVAMSSDTAVDTASGTSLAINGVLSGSGALTKTSAGTLVLGNGGNTYSGATNLSGGILQVAAAGALGNTSALNITSATLKTSADMDIPAPVTLAGTGATVDTDPSTVTFSGAVTGTGSLTKVNAGSLILSNSGNTYSGGTSVNGGSLFSAANNALGTGNVSVNAATLDIGATNNTVGTVTLTSGTVSGTAGVLSGNSFGVQSGSVSAILGGTGALTKTTGGTVTLSGANTFTGATNVNGGALVLSENASNSSSLSIASGATLEYAISSGLKFNSGTTISGSGTLRKSGAGTVNFGAGGVVVWQLGSGALIDVQGGELTGGSSFNDNWVSNLADLNVASGAIFSGVEASVRVNALTGSGTVKTGYGSNSGSIAVGVDNGSGTFSGVIADTSGGDTGALVKLGSGTQALTGASTYSGGTTVSAGTLRVNNTSGSGTGSGDVNVSSGAFLAGSGSIAGNVIVNTGGHVAAGNSIGTITVGGLTLNAGAVLDTEVGAPNNIDEIVVTTPSTGLTLNGGTVNLTDVGGLNFGTYVVIDYNTAFAGSLGNLSVGTAPSGFNYSLFNDTTATAIELIVSEQTAASAMWNVDASGNWSTLSNWTPGIPSGVDAVANFGSVITADRTVTLDSARTVGTVNLSNANSYTLAGSPLTLAVSSGNAAINVVTGSHTIASNVVMASDTTADVASASSLSISGAISGSNSLTKANAGTLFLSGTNTYTGATNLNGGVVSVSANANLGDPNNALNFAGGTLATTGSFDSARAVTLAGSGGTVDAASGVTTTFSGTVAGSGDLTKSNSGTLVLSNSGNSYTGATNINGGTLVASVAGSLGGTSAISINGATLKTAADMDLPAPVTLGIAGGTVDTDPSNVTFSGAVSGSGSLTKVNAGTLTLSNSGNTYSGGTIVNGGSVISAADNALGTGNVTVNAATLDVGTSNNSVGVVTLTSGTISGTTGVLSGSAFNVQAGSISASLAGSGALTKSGTDTVTVSGGNTYTGGTNINAGTLALGAQDVMPSAGAINVNGGTFDIGGFFSNTGPVTLASGTITSTNGGIAASSYDVRSGSITAHFFGAGDITKSTAGTVTMGTSNATWNGNTFVSLGTLITTADFALPSGALTVNGGMLDITTSNQSTGLVTLSSGSIAGTTGICNGAAYDVRSGTISANIAGAGALTKSTGGTVTLSGSANSYSGGTNVNAGTLVSGANNALGTGNITVATGTLDVGATNNSVGVVNLSSGGSIAGTTGVLSASSSINVQDGSISAGLAGAASLSKTSAGTVTLSNVNTYSGGTGITGGTLIASVNNALPSGGAVSVNGGTLDIGATSHTASAVTLITGAINGTAGSALAGDSFDVRDGSISAGLAGTGAMIKSTAGVVNLTGDSSYSGGTTISAGVLRVNNATGSGTGSGNVAVSSGATLGGSGTITGGVNVASGGHLAPGNSIGTITVAALTLNSGSVLDMEVGTPPSSDQIIVTTPSTGLTLNGGEIDLTDAGGLGAGTYVLIDYDTAFAGSLSNLFINSAPGGFGYSLVNDVSATAIDLVVTTGSNGTWKFDASGNWTPVGNWVGGSPNGIDASATLGNVITAARTVTVDAPKTVGTLAFDNANSYTVAGSTLTLQTSSGNAAINVLNGSHTIAAPVAMASDTTVDTATGTMLNITGVLSGSSSLTKANAGTLVLSNGGNTYSGATNVNGGVLQVAAAGALGNTSALNLTSATLKTSADMNIPAPVTLAGTGATVDTDPSNVTFSGPVSGTGSLTKVNAGSLTLSNSGNTYSGGTTVNGGTLASAANNALGTGNVTVNAATLDVGGSNNSVGAVTLTSGTIAGTTGVLSGTAFDVRSGSISAILGGSGALTKTTAATVTLSGANTYGGGTNVNAGTLALAANNALPATGAVTVNGATLDIGTSSTSAGLVTLASGSITGASGVLSGSSYNVQSGTASANLGGGPLVKSTTGTVTLSGANTYTGGSSINGGVLSVAADNNLGAAAGNLSFGGGTLQLTGSFASSRNISVAAASTGTITNSGANSFSGTVASNTGQLTKAGSGSLTLSGVVSGSNGYNVTGGTLALTNLGNLVTGPVSVTGGSTLSLAGSGAAGGATGDVTLDTGTLSNTDATSGNNFLAATRSINVGAGGGTINVPAASGTALVYSGSILGPGNTVTKTGTGTLRNTSPVSNTFSKLVVTGGLWQSNTDAGFGAVPTAVVADQITLNGGGISANAAMQLNTNRGITVGPLGGTLDATTNLTYNGSISGGATGALSITGAVANTSFTIGGASTYGGGTTLAVNTGGTGLITLGSDTPFGTGKVNVVLTGSGSPVFTSPGVRTLANAFDLNGGIALSGTNAFNFTGPMTVINASAGGGRTLQTNTSGLVATFGSSVTPSTITIGNPTSNGGDNVGKTLTLTAVAGSSVIMNDVMQDPAPGGGTASGGVVPSGAGIVRFNAMSTYTGITNLSSATAVTVQIGSSSNSSPFTAGPFGTGILQPNNGTNSPLQPIDADRVVANPVSLVTGFTVNNATGQTFGLTLSGPVTLNSTQGRTINNSMAAGATLTFGLAASPSTITLNTSSNLGTSITLSLANGVANTTFNSVIQDPSPTPATPDTMAISGGGTVTLNALNTFRGGVSLTGAGTIIPIVLSSNALPGVGFTSGPFGTGTLTFNNASNQHIRPVGNQVISNALLLTTGFAMDTALGDTASSLTFAGPVTMTNNRFISNGFTALQAGGTLIMGSAAAPNVITMPATSSFTLSYAALNGNIIVNDQMVNAAGQTDILSINPNGNDTFAVALNGQNTFTGGTSIGSSANNSGGVVIVGVDSVGAPGSITSGPFGTAAVTMNMTGTGTPPQIQPGGTGAGRTIANAITLTSGFFASNTTAQNLTFTGPMTLGTTSRVITDNMQSGTTLTLGGLPVSQTITASSALVIQSTLPAGTSGPTVINDVIKDGTAAAALTAQNNVFVTLATANTYTGNTSITTGATLSISASNNLGAVTNSLVMSAGTLRATASLDNPRSVSLTSTGGTVDTLANTVSFSGVVSGSGDLTKVSAGTLVLSNTNTNSGATHITAGVVQVSASANLGNDSATNTLDLAGGTLKTTADFAMNRLVTLTGPGGTIDTDPSTVTFNGVVSGSGALNKINAGTLVLTNTNTYSGPTNISGGGAVSVGSSANLGDGSTTNGISMNNGTLIATGSLSSASRNVSLPGNGTINAGGAVTLGNIDGVGSLTKTGSANLTANHIRGNVLTVVGGNVAIAPNGLAAGVSVVNSMVLGSNELDLSDNHLVSHADPVGAWNGLNYTGLTGAIVSGRNGGTWDGPGLVTSQPDAQNSRFKTLAIAQASDIIPASASTTVVWAGQTVTGTDTLVMYTYGGDANLDGQIDIDDYIRTDMGFAGHMTGWSNGDFNLDGRVNIDDYITVIDTNFPNQGAPFFATRGLGGVASLGGGENANVSAVSAVPEPAGMLVVGLGALGYLGQRRRKNEKPLQR